jgi:hypothetical protein
VKNKSISLSPKLGFLYRIGECPKCMREAFILAFSLCVFSIIYFFANRFGIYKSQIFEYSILVVTPTSLFLWLLHVGVRTYRILHNDVTVDQRRRTFLKRTLLVLAGIALSTAIPSIANARGECPGRLNCGWGTCAQQANSQAYCCPKGYPILSLCNCRCYRSVQGLPCNQTGSCFDENF